MCLRQQGLKCKLRRGFGGKKAVNRARRDGMEARHTVVRRVEADVEVEVKFGQLRYVIQL